MSNDKKLEDKELAVKYQEKTPIEHVLHNTAMYVGSTELIDSSQYICSDDGTIISKTIQYNPGFNKICDELFVNATDHATRTAKDANKVTKIEVMINKVTGQISVTNDGPGIDVAQHPESKTWIPEMIFARLRTSTNYDKDEKKIVGGMNGLGAKLAIILSSAASVRTIDSVRGLEYFQEFSDNLAIIGTPVIKKSKVKSFTTITIQPDYKRFGLTNGLTDDIMALLKRRVYDMAAIVGKGVKVKFNDELIPVKSFKQYIDLFIGTDTPRVYEESGERWEYAVCLSKDSDCLSKEFNQISWVNGIYTSDGGKHVEYILNQITRKLADYIETKKKVKVNPSYIKEQLSIFVRCDIENPVFNSQTKEYMNSPVAKFGSTCTVGDKVIEKLAKMGVMEAACALTELKDNKAAKKTDGQKTKNVRGIPKLTDANWAGTDKAKDCMLLLCEGDSAKSGIISGLSSDDRNTVGVYPLKGKPMNALGESAAKISANKEITEIKKILGLESKKEYKTIDDVYKNLRYGKILFMTDQDLDGSHIKGLCINLFQTEWPSLAKIPGFIGFMNTPILKAKKGNFEMEFYNDGEYEEWKAENDTKGWTIKYYKGLGTSTGKEFREYFAKKKIVGFEHSGTKCDDAINMVFNKDRADDRKEWLEDYDRELYLDTNRTAVSYDEFIHNELIHFSKYDCDRSIPNLMDGQKTSLRKILFAAFKKGLTSEIKVAQFSGYVSENSCYHHGEASLNGAIVGMAQNFVGSNNINLLIPSGQFGTRLRGGDDSASERYIFTALSKITRTIFPAVDDNVLNYLDDDGTPVEPQFYAPIIPMVLVNGSKGIGTGFSTNIMCYNPMEIIDYLKVKLADKGLVLENDFVPYYEGFQGTIEKVADKKFVIKGKYEILGPDKIRVVELPVGYWTEDFKELLEHLIDPGQDKAGKKILPTVKDYQDMSKDTNVDFTIQFVKGKMDELGNPGIEKVLKLATTCTSTNMHLFDANDKLKKYDTVEAIIDDYFVTRLELYGKRKEFMIKSLERELMLLSNKAKYIQENLDGTIDLRKKNKEQINIMLSGYDVIDGDKDYKYLTKMTMDSVTDENVAKLFAEHSQKQTELDTVKATTDRQMWSSELDKLKNEYVLYKEERQRLMAGTEKDKPKKKVVSKGAIKK
jgi:DNA topoisomerase-2